MKFSDWFDNYAMKTSILNEDVDVEGLEKLARAAYNAGKRSVNITDKKAGK